MSNAPTCVWSQQGKPDYDFYETTCGQAFEFNEGGPEENEFHFCPYCGAEIEEAVIG